MLLSSAGCYDAHATEDLMKSSKRIVAFVDCTDRQNNFQKELRMCYS